MAAVPRERDTFQVSAAAARERGPEATGWTMFLYTDRGTERLRLCVLCGALNGCAWGAAAGGALGHTADAEWTRLDLEGYRRLLDGRPFALTLRPMRPDATDASKLRAKVAVVRRFPVGELSFSHYGLAPLAVLAWVREAPTRDVHDDAGPSRGSAPAPRG